MTVCVICRQLACISVECSVVLRARLESGCFDAPARVERERSGGRVLTPDQYRTQRRAA